MNKTVRLLVVCIFLATSTLAAGYIVSGLGIWSLLMVVLVTVWLIGVRGGWNWLASIMLSCFIGASIVGFWIGYNESWIWFALAGLIATLSAWDLNHFLLRWQPCDRRSLAVGEKTNQGEITGDEAYSQPGFDLEQNHLNRLLAVVALGFLLAVLALTIHTSQL